jgi:hypothetical protein
VVDRAVGEAAAHGQAAVAAADDDGGYRPHEIRSPLSLWVIYFTSTVTLVGLVTMS